MRGILEWEWSTTSTNINIIGTYEHTAQIVGTSPGFANIKVRTRNACGWSQSAYLMVQVENCNFLNSDIRVFPNPANETLTISVGDDGASGQAQQKNQPTVFTAIVYDGSGRQHRQGESKDGAIQFDTGNLPEGTYFVHIHKGGEVEKRQVVSRH
ncbi:T9SS type A sorting domain-containing protein [Parapedobacter sp. 10938]|uniref:T9SS type A sorting domain-containing protein n=1 Tax=Parapedobacter flavus TaxID=3110225 RepID=UPI002DB644D0|nr:T9SS type A sorting domain-containing protein [Parapedobacter sp. 10938]MEC3878752.1 T9SS type A sorting domain-containing protein [Parapedobacter sp. 10938]